MRQELAIYSIFTLALVLAIFLLPTYFLSETVAVLLSVLVVIKHIHKLSIVILVLVVASITIAWPIFILFMIGKDTEISLLDYANIRNVISFVMPTFAVIVLVAAARTLQRKQAR